MGWLLNPPLALKCWGPSGGRRPRRSPSGGRRRCGRRASCDITIIPRIRTGLRRSSRMRSGREAWRSGSAAVIKAATGCLRHTLARTAERRAVQQPDYPAAAGDLQELASVTVCARQPRRAALRPSRPTHNQAARARHFSDLVIRLAMSAHRGKADLAESMIGAELLWRRRALHRTSRPGDRRTAHSATAGTAPVPSHIAYFGGAVVLDQSGGPLSRGTHGRV